MSLAALAAWAATARPPSGVLRRAGLVLADDLAAMLAFRDVPELRRLRERLAPTAHGEAMVIGTSRRAPRRDAAALNAAAACWGEMDGGHALSRSHPNLMVIPALLAEAELQAASVRTALVALAVGYEVAARMGMYYAAHPILVHPHAQFAAIGAAAAVARLRRFRAARLHQALAMAASMALAGPFTHAQQGATVRNAWAGLGAGLGFAACDLAEAGFSGAQDAPAAVFAGLFAGHDGSAELARGLGEHWAIGDAYQKFTSACHYAHAAVEAAVTARSELGSLPDAVEEVLVETFPLALSLGNPHPRCRRWRPGSRCLTRSPPPWCSAIAARGGARRPPCMTAGSLHCGPRCGWCGSRRSNARRAIDRPGSACALPTGEPLRRSARAPLARPLHPPRSSRC